MLCEYKNIEEEDLIKLLQDKECKYLLFLLLKKHRCTDKTTLAEMLPVKSKRSIDYNFKRAEEKLYINKEFREKYFEIEDIIKKII
ncbi:ribose-5-phosphate isomerase [Clostridium sp. MSJ-4]|uniref:Ribose-5-phosphate isomerase n=2 Tax=Clostridiaceae TaxID=31979 RepID=A0ABS6EVN8_9CLOT|nr:ribose-5-phosphate isomerase [Clostridium simiarum]MBU5590297.1 ribose-5-phosphate isomerase [Clostridium simiarum]